MAGVWLKRVKRVPNSADTDAVRNKGAERDRVTDWGVHNAMRCSR